MVQMSFSLNGAFCPTILPLFQGVRRSLPLAFEIMTTSLLRWDLERCAAATAPRLPPLRVAKSAFGVCVLEVELRESAKSGRLRRSASEAYASANRQTWHPEEQPTKTSGPLVCLIHFWALKSSL